ncbi:alpha/beta hydrolase family protein [Georgenia thermotolerans]|uniref:Prolyl oligopeptidase family serine peptidase n=1 Tax=Georgenia thermotolerans TaxID=527326 RepID=A0A7J5UQA4_9MICO|nr:prolyl oligopeptidase family serine peptidase [Georgenia thermotolerans]KAE8764529.1 prolyl oligopeptidase family serine peptidase [Georgenia thermotolerans]
MRYRRLAATIVVVLLLGLVGTVAGPGWNPRPLGHTIVPETADTAIGSDALTPPVGTFEVHRQVVDVRVEDGVSVKATIASPVGARGLRPGVVFMHGAGTATHENFADITTDLASAGIVTLVPDKRTDTYTTRDRNYVAMAADYLDSLEVLRRWPGVDPGRVGVYGESEGAMSAPIAAAHNPDVAFVVLVSAPVLPIREQGAFAADTYLREVGVPDRLLRAIPRLVGGQFPGGGFEYFDFDVSPYQQRMRQPVLLVYGTADASMPIVQGAERLLADLAAAHNDQYTIRYYHGANHGIRVDGQLAPHFTEDLARWVQGLPDTASAEPRVAGAEPVQQFRAGPVANPRWYASGDMIVLTLVAGFGLLVLGLLAWAGGQLPRLWGRPASTTAPPVGRYTLALALATVATWVIFVAYLAGVADLALNYRTNALFVQGGWIAVQAVGILAATMLVLTVTAAWRQARARRGSVVMGRVGWLAVACTVLGCVVLLLSAAYWGVYPAVP